MTATTKSPTIETKPENGAATPSPELAQAQMEMMQLRVAIDTIGQVEKNLEAIKDTYKLRLTAAGQKAGALSEPKG